MKKVKIFVAIVLMSLSVNVIAQNKTSKEYQDFVQKSFLYALTSKNDEVRNSAIFVILKAKAEFPKLHLKSCIKEIQKMSNTDIAYLNRVHAQLAMICFERPDFLQSINLKNHIVASTFFKEIHKRLTEEKYTMK